MVKLPQLKTALFLKEFKQLVENKGLYVIARHENRKSLITLGLTENNREEEILSLSLEDYCQGPMQDKDKPGKVWVFGKEISEKEVYIKLKIAESSSVKIAKCISFHIADHPLHYPYKL